MSNDQWSLTESLVLSFRLNNDRVDTWTTNIVDGIYGDTGGTQEGNEGEGSNGESDPTENPLKGLDGTASGEVNAHASRTGFIFYTFTASRGVSAPSAAGVQWSVTTSYSDTINVLATGSGDSTYQPTSSSGTTTGGSGSGGWVLGDEGNSEGGTNTNSEFTYPSDFTASSSWDASSTLALSNSGAFSISVSPSLTSSGQVRVDTAASMVYDSNGSGNSTANWTSNSASGDLSVSANGICIVCMVGNGGASGGGSGTAGETTPDDWYDTDPNDDMELTIDPSPLQMEGSGHSASSNGSGTSAGAGGVAGSFSMTRAIVANELLDWGMQAANNASGSSSDSSSGGHNFLFRDKEITPTMGGTKTVIVEYTAGWKGDGSGNGNALGNGSIASSASSQLANNSSGSVEGDSVGSGSDYIYLKYHEYGNTAIDSVVSTPYGNDTVDSETSNDLLLVYRSQNRGDIDGNGIGNAAQSSSDSEIESNVDGDGNSLLIRIESIVGNGTSYSHDSTGVYHVIGNDSLASVLIAKVNFGLMVMLTRLVRTVGRSDLVSTPVFPTNSLLTTNLCLIIIL